MAQRVMDCGDAGHILLSRHVAEDLEQYRQWQPCLHDLGDCEVKHGARVHVVNLYTDELGNAEVPEKFRQANGKEQTTPVTPASDAKPAGRSRAWIIALIIVAAAAAAGFYIYSHRSSSKAPPSSAAPAVPIIPEKTNAAPSEPAVPEKSIAVLPFLDLSQAKDQEYFCDGMSEEILDALAKVEGLRVVARTSSFSFKGTSVDVNDVRKKLNVENVLEGSLRREGNRVRITAQLINTRNGFHLWSETYERELQGVFALQDEITRSIVEALKIKLAVSLPAHEQRSPEAYDLYLQGLYFSNKGSEEDLRNALGLFQRALDKDPKFSRAWTGIAKVWFFLADVYVKPLEAYPASKAAALKAIALDEKDAEAHCYLGEAKRRSAHKSAVSSAP
jgi:TolB-like protein